MINSNQIVSPEYWCEEDKLIILEGWSRDGLFLRDIATQIGISVTTLNRWIDKYPAIRDALSKGRQLVDYKVENALLKSALGYKTKEVRVMSILRNGKVIREEKETLTKEQAPNVQAIQTYLYNRLPGKWKKPGTVVNLEDDVIDNNLEITITRAKSDEDNDTQVEETKGTKQTKVKDRNYLSPMDEYYATSDEVNEEIVIKPGKDARKTKKAKKTKRKVDRDAWPDEE